MTGRSSRAWLAPLLIGAVLTSAGTAHAAQHDATARYVARPAGGGQIVLQVDRGRLRRLEAALPARCENNHGGSWSSTLGIAWKGDVALQSGRFAIQGRASNDVRYQLGGRLRDGAISGRLRLTFLDLDFVGVDDSYLCDTGTRRYRGVRRS
jgi:hypothetical protein